MAKAAKTKTSPRKKKADEEIEEIEPLSTYQEVEKTGRVDPDASSSTKAQSKHIVVTEVRVVDKQFLSVTYSKIEGDGSTSNHTGVLFEGRYVHPDTIKIFNDLRIHMALACEFVSVNQLKNIKDYNQKLVDQFTVLKVKLKEDGVYLTGQKLIKSGPWNFTANMIRYSNDQDSTYRYIDDLTEKLERLQQEVIKYIEGTKVGQDPQGTLEFPEDHLVEEGL